MHALFALKLLEAGFVKKQKQNVYSENILEKFEASFCKLRAGMRGLGEDADLDRSLLKKLLCIFLLGLIIIDVPFFSVEETSS